MVFGQPGGPTGKYEYGGGYVGKGEPGLKIVDDDTFIYVIDFASLYPTIIIAFNICYTDMGSTRYAQSIYGISVRKWHNNIINQEESRIYLAQV